MILISHRGNVNGRKPEEENNPDYIQTAIGLGYDVEIDIWYVDNKLYLGHDEPQYEISWEYWLKYRVHKLWIHCKNVEAVVWFSENTDDANYFWHENDTLTLTSLGHMWVYPGRQPVKNSIAVMPEIHNDNISMCKGICSDYVQKYKI